MLITVTARWPNIQTYSSRIDHIVTKPKSSKIATVAAQPNSSRVAAAGRTCGPVRSNRWSPARMTTGTALPPWNRAVPRRRCDRPRFCEKKWRNADLRQIGWELCFFLLFWGVWSSTFRVGKLMCFLSYNYCNFMQLQKIVGKIMVNQPNCQHTFVWNS